MFVLNETQTMLCSRDTVTPVGLWPDIFAASVPGSICQGLLEPKAAIPINIQITQEDGIRNYLARTNFSNLVQTHLKPVKISITWSTLCHQARYVCQTSRWWMESVDIMLLYITHHKCLLVPTELDLFKPSFYLVIIGENKMQHQTMMIVSDIMQMR